jgi:hypothetical protein
MWEDGSTRLTATYINGNIQGHQTAFYKGTSQIQEMTQYACNKRHGTHREHYPSGRIKLEASFKDDNPFGMFKVKYDNASNSQMIFCSFTQNGVIDGEFKVYDENGEPKITMFFNHLGECTNKIELTDFKMSEQCKEFFDNIIQFNDINKSTLKTQTTSDDFDRVWDNVLHQKPDSKEPSLPPLLTFEQKPHSNQSGYYSGYQSSYSGGTVYNADYWKTLNANRETEYESQLAKAIEESRTQTENTTVATVSFRSLIEAHRDEQTALHDAKKEQDPLRYLQEMCIPWFTLESQILTGQ